MKTVKLSAVVKKLDLHVVRTSSDYETIEITNSEINRPGLQLSGFLEEFPFRRIQLFGKAELAYYMAMDIELRKERVRAMMEYDIPCIVFSHYAQIPDEVRKLAEEYDKTLLISDRTTTRLISALDEVLEYFLSEEDTIHASLLDVFGMGVLLMGDSYVGKSETALDLVTRGHRLVADDVVEI
ncbi:MAG: HPr kinase/phosphorylase, partial [Finegoldia magna]|nr:HPr kinase/phosphorylase [Finegoldia magna]